MRRIRRSHCLFVLVLIVIGGSLCADVAVRAQSLPKPSPSPTPKTHSLEQDFFKNVLRDQKAFVTAPLHLESDDAKWLVPSSIGLMGLFTTDRITGDEIAESNHSLNASRIISYAGSEYTLGAFAGSVYLIGRKKNDLRLRETGILSGEALLDGVIVGSALKAITQRVRPKEGIDRSEFFDGGSSFPSGHSIAAWSVASVIADEFHDHRLIQVAAYGIAGAVSTARVTGQKHYISDVVVGSALGFGIGHYVYHAHHRDHSGSVDETTELTESRWPAIIPTLDRRGRQYGVSFTWQF